MSLKDKSASILKRLSNIARQKDVPFNMVATMTASAFTVIGFPLEDFNFMLLITSKLCQHRRKTVRSSLKAKLRKLFS